MAYTLTPEMGSVQLEEGWEKNLELDGGLHEMGANIVTTAKRLAPVRTGALRNSIGYQVKDGKLYVYADTPYAGFVELGTYKMKAQPYLRPAMDSALEAMQ